MWGALGTETNLSKVGRLMNNAGTRLLCHVGVTDNTESATTLL